MNWTGKTLTDYITRVGIKKKKNYIRIEYIVLYISVVPVQTFFWGE